MAGPTFGPLRPGSPTWVAALGLMALADELTRLVIIYLSGRRLSGQHRCRPGRRPRLTAPARRGQLSR